MAWLSAQHAEPAMRSRLAKLVHVWDSFEQHKDEESISLFLCSVLCWYQIPCPNWRVTGTLFLCPSRTSLRVTPREIGSVTSDAKHYWNVRKKLINPSWFSNMLNLPQLPLMLWVARPQKPQKCLCNFFIARLWASQQGSDLMVLTVSGCTAAWRPWGRVASFSSLTVV